MAKKHCFWVLFISAVITSVVYLIFFIQPQSCTLPGNGGVSSCSAKHKCLAFKSNLIFNLKMLQCENSATEWICCPKHTESILINDSYALVKTNLDEIKNHINIHLINHETCGTTLPIQPSNSHIAELNEFPWVVRIKLKNGIICGGTLITMRYVLSTSQCFREKDIENASIQLGGLSAATEEDCKIHNEEKICAPTLQNIEIEKVILHKGWNYNNNMNNIALIRLKKEAEYATNIRTICLPTEEKIVLVNLLKAYTDEMIVTGWSAMENETEMNVLLKATVSFIPYSSCQAEFNNIEISESFLCNSNFNTKGFCQGNTGGGIFAFSFFKSTPHIIQYGVIHGDEKNCINHPGLSTDLSFYIDWILDNLEA